MQLPEEDEAYLNDKGYTWELIPHGDEGCLILKGYRLAVGKYDRESVDVMIRIPKGYNNAKLDMFYVDPPVKLATTAQYPNQADAFIQAGGRNWQRFSRHLPQWRAGSDRLRNFLPLANRELQDAK